MERQTLDESPVIDSTELIARCMGNLEFAERLLGKFQGRLDDDIVQLEHALQAQNTDLIARVAHRIKGASANIAAHPLRQRAAEIEHSARENSLTTIPSQLDELRAELVERSLRILAEPI